jgi:hypothetical protein
MGTFWITVSVFDQSQHEATRSDRRQAKDRRLNRMTSKAISSILPNFGRPPQSPVSVTIKDVNLSAFDIYQPKHCWRHDWKPGMAANFAYLARKTFMPRLSPSMLSPMIGVSGPMMATQIDFGPLLLPPPDAQAIK